MKEKPKKSVRIWVARDKGGALFLFKTKPTRSLEFHSVWYPTTPHMIQIDSDLFPSVKWEDKEYKSSNQISIV